MIHASPGSSKMLSSLIGQLGNNRQVYATDTLGNGDSAPPKVVSPDIAYFAEAHMRAFDALELKTFDLYGTHTGGCIAAEIAIRHPQRVNRMILDGMSLYSDVERADMLEHYALEIKPDLNGAYLAWAWHFCRDNYLFWPWYKRDQDHRRALGLPAADVLHDKLVEVLKAVKSYHLSYHAAIDYKKPDRLPLVLTSTLLTCARNDMLLQYFDEVATLLAHAERSQNAGVATPAALAETAGIFQRFLDKGGASNASGGSRAGH
jgi:pimeloyl-ACP methyl ester carboxylesterase